MFPTLKYLEKLMVSNKIDRAGKTPELRLVDSFAPIAEQVDTIMEYLRSQIMSSSFKDILTFSQEEIQSLVYSVDDSDEARREGFLRIRSSIVLDLLIRKAEQAQSEWENTQDTETKTANANPLNKLLEMVIALKESLIDNHIEFLPLDPLLPESPES